MIKGFEGLSLTAYLCPAGVPTIGYGHTGKDVTRGDVTSKRTITETEASALLEKDLRGFVADVNRLTKGVILNQNQFDALVSFCYNLGAVNLSGSGLLRKILKNPNDTTIRNEFMKWVYSGKVRLRGLETRRDREANHYFLKD